MSGESTMQASQFTSPIVIGLEIHIELHTKTKLFCGCPTSGKEEPNTRTCVTCLGMPGSKPVLNKAAVDYAIKLALALNCKIHPELIFSRKSYFYPDMAKNYQISQYELPLATKGSITLSTGKNVSITRAHLEEDPASLVHPGGMAQASFVLIDYNRSGNPLVEVVTEPVLESPEEARDFMKQLIALLSYLEIFDEKNGIIKVDANISIKESGYVKIEVKNITGFKEIERALQYEVVRQKKEVKEQALVQETRAWNAEQGITTSLRKKETEADYGYIIDPDLVVVELPYEKILAIQKTMPELPQQKAARYVTKFKLDPLDANVIVQDKLLASLFEKVAKKVNPILAARWLRRELVRVLNYNQKELYRLAIDEHHLIDLLSLVEQKKITDATGKRLLEKLVEKPFEVMALVKKEKLEAVADTIILQRLCKEVIAENSQAVLDYQKGNEKALHFMVGKVMAKTKGAATPPEVQKLLKELMA